MSPDPIGRAVSAILNRRIHPQKKESGWDDTYEVYSFSPADRIAGVRCCGHTMTAEAQRFAPRHARVLAGQLSPHAAAWARPDSDPAPTHRRPCETFWVSTRAG